MQVGDRARLAEAARAAIDAAGGEAARSGAAHRHGAGERRCRHAAVRARSTGRWPTFRARGSPARSPSPTGRCTTFPTRAPGGAPLNVLIPAKGEETDRRLRVIEAPSYGIVGKSVTLRVAIEDLGVAHPVRLRQSDHPPRRRAAARRERADRRRAAHRGADHPRRSHGGRTVGQPAARRGLAPSTTARWSRSTACATGCACC